MVLSLLQNIKQVRANFNEFGFKLLLNDQGNHGLFWYIQVELS